MNLHAHLVLASCKAAELDATCSLVVCAHAPRHMVASPVCDFTSSSSTSQLHHKTCMRPCNVADAGSKLNSWHYSLTWILLSVSRSQTYFTRRLNRRNFSIVVLEHNDILQIVYLPTHSALSTSRSSISIINQVPHKLPELRNAEKHGHASLRRPPLHVKLSENKTSTCQQLSLLLLIDELNSLVVLAVPAPKLQLCRHFHGFLQLLWSSTMASRNNSLHAPANYNGFSRQ